MIIHMLMTPKSKFLVQSPFSIQSRKCDCCHLEVQQALQRHYVKNELVILPFPIIFIPQDGGGGNGDIECLYATIILHASHELVYLIVGGDILNHLHHMYEETEVQRSPRFLPFKWQS